MRVAFVMVALLASAAHAEELFELDASTDTAIFVVTNATSLVLTLRASTLIRPSCPCDPLSVNGFDRGAIGNHSAFADRLSDVTVVLATLAPLASSYAENHLNLAFFKDAVVLGEVLSINTALVTLTKYAVQRPLPLTYAGDPSLVPSPGGYRSFYSGHTSTAFAALTVFAYTLQLRGVRSWWPWALGAAVGASVAVERVLAGRHFPTDVIVGAAMGTLVGWVVPALHRNGAGIAVSFDETGARRIGLSFRF